MFLSPEHNEKYILLKKFLFYALISETFKELNS